MSGLDVTILQKQIERDLRQVRFAAMRALNETAFEVMRAEQRAMQASLDRPRPQTVRSVRVIQATRENLLAQVRIDDYIFDAEEVLLPQVEGGDRALKAAEKRLQRQGLMPVGMFMVPGRGAPLDAYGNVPGTFIRRLLGYFQAFQLAGSDNNLSKRRIAQLAKRGRNARGFATINGVEYFISMGQGERNGRQQHLPPGIWSRKGVHGSTIERVFKYVPKPGYRARFRFFEVANNVAAREFEPRFNKAQADAMRTAR